MASISLPNTSTITTTHISSSSSSAAVTSNISPCATGCFPGDKISSTSSSASRNTPPSITSSTTLAITTGTTSPSSSTSAITTSTTSPTDNTSEPPIADSANNTLSLLTVFQTLRVNTPFPNSSIATSNAVPSVSSTPAITTVPTDTTSNPNTTGVGGSNSDHRTVPVGLAVGVVVAALCIFVIIIYFYRKRITRKNRGLRRESSLTVEPLDLRYLPGYTSSSRPTSKGQEAGRNGTLQRRKPVIVSLDSSRTTNEEHENGEKAVVDGVERTESNDTPTTGMERHSIFLLDVQENLIPHSAVGPEQQIEHLQQQVQMMHGVIQLLAVESGSVDRYLSSPVSEPPPDYNSDSGTGTC